MVDRPGGQVGTDTEPDDNTWSGGVETVSDQLLLEAVLFEIAWHPDGLTAFRRWQVSLGDRALVALRRRRIDLENCGRVPGLAQAGRVESGAEQHDLVDAVAHGGIADVVGVTHPQHDVGVQPTPQPVQDPDRRASG